MEIYSTVNLFSLRSGIIFIIGKYYLLNVITIAKLLFFPDISNSSFVQFQIWDFPGQIDFFDPAFDSEMIFGGCGALIFVIDAQVNYPN